MAESILVEQFAQILPREGRDWVLRHQPESLAHTAVDKELSGHGDHPHSPPEPLPNARGTPQPTREASHEGQRIDRGIPRLQPIGVLPGPKSRTGSPGENPGPPISARPESLGAHSYLPTQRPGGVREPITWRKTRPEFWLPASRSRANCGGLFSMWASEPPLSGVCLYGVWFWTSLDD